MTEAFNENVVEWITNDKTITVTLSQRKFITKIKKLAEKHPEDVQIIHENPDGSIVAHLPLKALKFNISNRTFTDEQRQAIAERMRIG